jgi:Phosphotransferase enzyme family
MTAPSPSLHDAESFSVGLDRLLGRGTRTITVAASRDPNPKITMLLLRPGSAAPMLAVKIPTTPVAAVAVEAEGRVLARLSERLPAGLLGTVPRVVAELPSEHGHALVTTALPGTPMSTRYHRWHHVSHRRSVELDFAAGARWIARLQTGTAAMLHPLDLAGGLAPRLAQRFAGTAAGETAVERLGELDRRLRAACTPRTVVHGDFWPGNVLMRGTAVTGVVDWEAAELFGEPVRDVVRFVLAYTLYLDRHTRPGSRVWGHPGLRSDRWGAGVQFALDGSGWLPRLVRDFTAAHLVRLGVDGERWRDVIITGIAEVAVTADDPDFARNHLELFVELARTHH